MAFVVLYDACVLWSAPLRDLLVRVAIAGLVQARWTDAILDETFRAIHAKRPDLAPASLQRTRELMNNAVRDALVRGHEPLVAALDLSDADDRHVLAAAVHAGAQVIVTFNTSDFPPDRLAPHHVEALHPDDFVLDLLDLAEGTVVRILQEQAAALRNPPRTVEDLVGTLENCKPRNDGHRTRIEGIRSARCARCPSTGTASDVPALLPGCRREERAAPLQRRVVQGELWPHALDGQGEDASRDGLT